MGAKSNCENHNSDWPRCNKCVCDDCLMGFCRLGVGAGAKVDQFFNA